VQKYLKEKEGGHELIGRELSEQSGRGYVGLWDLKAFERETAHLDGPFLVFLESGVRKSNQHFFLGGGVFSWAAHTAYRGSQARGLIGAVAAGLHHSHSNVGSELSLRPTPQLTAMPDP